MALVLRAYSKPIIMYGKTVYNGLLLMALAACHTNTTNNRSSGTDSLLATPLHSDKCYQLLEGTTQQDTTTVHLVINDTLATGVMVVKRAEKDTRAGVLRGHVRGNLVETWWYYAQEGMADSLPANFKLYEDKLVEQRYSYDPATGREVLTDTSAFTIALAPVACKLPLR